ncbi:MAG: hypothetical protein ACLFUP_07495, partial [Desulfobacteraceae bacterium]
MAHEAEVKKTIPTEGSAGAAGAPKLFRREFHGARRHAVDLGMAMISMLVMYWTVNVMADMMIQRALYLMLTMGMCALVYP